MAIGSAIRSPLGATGKGGLTGVPPIVFEAETDTLLAAFSSEPTYSHKVHINSLIKRLKDAGIWTKLDLLYVLAAPDAQAAGLNWVAPATYVLSPQNSPTFTAYRGYAGDGATSYVNTGWAPSDGVNYTQDDATFFGFCLTDAANSGGWIGTGTSTPVRLVPRTAGNGLSYRINQTASISSGEGAIGTGISLVAATRTGATATQAYRNGQPSGSAGSVASAALSSDPINFGRYNNGFSNAQVASAGSGAALSPSEHAALYTALAAYMTAVGAT